MLLDETMSNAVRARLHGHDPRHGGRLYAALPSGEPQRVEGHVTHVEGRRHWAEAEILDAEGTTLAKGKGLLFEVQPR